MQDWGQLEKDFEINGLILGNGVKIVILVTSGDRYRAELISH